jgi:tRNA-dihydrouridine synthase
MNLGFWKNIRKPFLVMAPMADVTDAAFRRMFVKYSKYGGADIFDNEGRFKEEFLNKKTDGEYVTWTEFVSADGLALAPEEGRKRLMRAFDYIEAERPIVAQIFGSNPEHIEKAVVMVRELGFDGVDINMGCPDRSVEKQKAGAALIKNPELAKEIILSAKRGAGDMPVSVKTRLGYNKDELEKWLPKILEAEPALVTVHARTRKEMSLVPARWERVKRAVEIRDEVYERLNPTNFLPLHHSDTNDAEQSQMTKILKGKEKTLIAGNGDVTSKEDALQKIKESGADGAMVGRGLFGCPWFFSVENHNSKLMTPDSAFKLRLNALVEHTKLFEKLCEYKNFSVMKKHYKAYCHGFDGAKELRIKLMDAESGEEVEEIVKNFKLKM